MIIKKQLKFVAPLFVIFLLILSYFNFKNGYTFKQKIVFTDIRDKNLAKELSNIKQSSKLDTIKNNIDKFKILIQKIFTEVIIVDSGKKKASAGIDKIGEFKDFIVTVKGDYLSQIYLLNQINDLMRSFVVLNSIESNDNNMKLNIRIYGKTDNKTK
jgi:hypothetical protein